MLDKIITKLMIWRLAKGFGRECNPQDTEATTLCCFDPRRCPACTANEVMNWLEETYELRKGNK